MAFPFVLILHLLLAVSTQCLAQGPPVITTQPQSQSVRAGSAVTFTVVVSSVTFPTYQWRFNGTNIPGATSFSYMINNVQTWHAGNYSVAVTNAVGYAISSNAALTIGFVVVAWGNNTYGQTNVPAGLSNVVAIAAGAYHCLAAKSDGTVVAWGNNASGQTNVPAGLSNVVAVAAGDSHSLALKSDGTIVPWGNNAYGQTNAPSGLNDVVAIAAGANHSLAIKNDGTVMAWGSNNHGQTNVPAWLGNAVAVAGGVYHSLALRPDGSVVAWGFNNYGQTNVPAGLSNVVTIAAGDYHNLALTRYGAVVAWGNNGNGQTNVPTGLNNVVAIAGGGLHSLGLKNSGTIIPWGNNTYGQTNVPVGLSNAVAIEAGAVYSLALKGSGSVVIAVQPYSQRVNAGDNATFTVMATGNAPLSYRWRFNGTDISGATNSSYTMVNVRAWHAGNYSVVVSNAGVSVPSAAATLTVLNAPEFCWVVTKGFSTSAGDDYGRALYGVRPDGQGGLVLLYEPAGLPGGTVFFSPQFREQELVFHAGTVSYPDRSGIYLGTVGSSTVQHVGYAGGYRDTPAGAIRWVPGTNQILFSNVGTGISQMDLDPNTDDEVALTSNYFDEVEAVRWENGLVFFSNALYRPGARIFTMNPDGSNIQPLDPFPDSTYARSPALSLDNSKLTVTRTSNPGIWLVDANTGLLISPADSPLVAGVPDYGENNGWFAWSPDSQTLAYVRGNQLYSIRVDGTQPEQQLTTGTFADLRVWGIYLLPGVAPAIITQPSSRTNDVGTMATFTVTASGAVPLSYQWKKDGAALTDGGNVSGATTDILSLSNVQTNDAGNYSVVVSNHLGTATSSNAMLTVSTTVHLAASGFTANGFEFRLTGPVGNYVIQASTNLINWIAIATTNTPTGVLDFTDTDAANFDLRFYRALAQ